jgi:hypothetical protein
MGFLPFLAGLRLAALLRTPGDRFLAGFFFVVDEPEL